MKRQAILLVEDELPLQEAISDKLKAFELDVLTARSYEEAMAHLEMTDDIALLWLDHHLMTEKTGLDLLIYLRNITLFAQLPVFVVSNTFDPEVKANYLSLGVRQHYDKAGCRLDLVINEILKTIEVGAPAGLAKFAY